MHDVEGGDHSLKVKGGAAATNAAQRQAVEAAAAFCLDIAEAGGPEAAGATAKDPANGVVDAGGDSVPPQGPGKGKMQKRGKVGKGEGPSEAGSDGGTGKEVPVPGNRKRRAASGGGDRDDADEDEEKGARGKGSKRDGRGRDSTVSRGPAKKAKVERKKRS